MLEIDNLALNGAFLSSIFQTLRNRRNPSTYFRNLNITQREKNTSQLDENKRFILYISSKYS